MLSFDRVDPSPTAGAASKEAGPSSSVAGQRAAGLAGVGVDGLVAVVAEAEQGDGGGKAGGSSLKPGLLGEGSRATGDRARLACAGRE